jgi:hypothetical protein
MMFLLNSSPARGGGPRPQGVVEGGRPQADHAWRTPSTMLRMIPLPVPGRN